MGLRAHHAGSVGALLVGLAATTTAESAHAYAWMVRHHYVACATCHVDPSGGEILTPYGRAQGELLLRTRYGEASASSSAPTAASADGGFDGFDSFDDFDNFDNFDNFDEPSPSEPSAPSQSSDPSESSGPEAGAEPPSTQAQVSESDAGPGDAAGFLWGVGTPDWLALGGSLRALSVYRPSASAGTFRAFPMQADVYGAAFFGSFQLAGSVGVARVPAGSVHARAAQLTTNQGEDFNAISRTHWLGYAIGDQWLVRAGRLNLPFGLRVPEHVLWAREQTQTDRDSDQQHGASVAYTGESFRAEVMAIAGNYQVHPDRYRERGYSLFGEWIASDSLTLGFSSLVTHAQADRIQDREEATLRQAHGVFSRWVPTAELAVLAEVDLLLRTARDPGHVGLLQLDYELTRGLHLIGTGEMLDQGYRPSSQWYDRRRRPGNGLPRFGALGGVQWFFYSHLDLRLDARYRQPRASQQADDAWSLLAQLHAYL